MMARLSTTVPSDHAPSAPSSTRDAMALQRLRGSAWPLTGAPSDFDPLLERVGDASLVLIGEASHGTADFYRMRAQISKALISDHGFTAVAVEADWPDAYRVNRHVRGEGGDADATAALGGFKRFPAWMWRNTEVRDFIAWLRMHNDNVDASRKTGFYGLDLYSLHTSIDAVLRYLEKVDPAAARRARYRYACFDHYGEDPQAYGYAASFDLDRSCEDEVVDQLVELRSHAASYVAHDGHAAADDLFFAEQNARLIRNAEVYYRAMFRHPVDSWNVRDTHMMEMLQTVRSMRSNGEGPAKVIVWAHNSHLGDARATQMGESGELNLGQLVREKAGDDAVLIGFSTFDGTVTAASDWDEPAQCRRVRPGLPGSYEELLHATGIPRMLLDLRNADVEAALRGPRLQRAIGVIYRPETERVSHYFKARLCKQFDMLIHLDRTSALVPLEPGERWRGGEPPEAYPSGL